MADVTSEVERLLGCVQSAAHSDRHTDRVAMLILQAARDLTLLAEKIIITRGREEEPPKPAAVPLRRTKRPDYLVLGDADGEYARRMYRERRLRDEIFGEHSLFGEPAWDILLDLLQSEVSRKPISITSACIASATPPTTALRYISQLIEIGLVNRTECDIDRRRAFVRISELGLRRMQTFLDRVARLK